MSSQEPVERLRLASKNERRHTMRQALGFYRALVITGLYSVRQDDIDFDMAAVTSYLPALRLCIATYPALSAAIVGEDSETPEFVRPSNLDLRNHVEILNSTIVAADNDLELLKQVTLKTHDTMFANVDRVPPWKIIVLPLRKQTADTLDKQFYVLFAYSHSHGDGKSGLAFHRTFLEGLRRTQQGYDRSFIQKSNPSPLPPPIEEACSLKISWSYLFYSLLGEYLPNLSRWSSSTQDALPWTGKPIEYDPANFHTGSETLIIKAHQLKDILGVCRKQRAKFTGLFNQLVVRAISECLPKTITWNRLVGQIAIDLRPLVPEYSHDSMVNCISVAYDSSPRYDEKGDEISGSSSSSKYDHDFWDAVRDTTAHLADSANSLVDQPIGLLRYISNFRPWYLGKLGKRFDASYEISNLGVFDPFPSMTSLNLNNGNKGIWDIQQIIFSQPANVTGCPLNFQLVTRKEGEMVMTMNWQVGILGVPDENTFAKDIVQSINKSLSTLAGGTF